MFLGGAMALLFPIDWPEPFGLVTIEAMANGAPVIAFRRGAATEVVVPSTVSRYGAASRNRTASPERCVGCPSPSPW